MNKEFLDNIQHAHFVGIGGIGVSAIARLMLARGISVRGSDRGPSLITEKLEQGGAQIFFGHDEKNFSPLADVVIYSPAIPADNPELVAAREHGVPAYSYPQALGLISLGMRTIAVSGTHGKTTTTAMIAEIFMGLGLSPTVIVGSLLKGSGSNFIPGTSNIFIVEACEYKRSFLNLHPEILVITNIDNDHLDYYGSVEGIQQAFAEMVEKVPAHGTIVCNPNDPLIAPVLLNAAAQIIDYTKESANSMLRVFGDHNVSNAKAAVAVARSMGIDEGEAMRGVATFEGTWRRMEYKGETVTGALVYDDYAHHPTEIRASLQGFRMMHPEGNIRVVFQPHLYSRTKLLFDDFARSFFDANEVIVAPIYAAREEFDPTITGEKLANAIRENHAHASSFEDAASLQEFLGKTANANDIIITMGAGDVYKIGEGMVI